MEGVESALMVSSFQRSKSGVQFLVARRAGDVMPHHASENLCLNRCQFAKNILDHCSAYGHERVSVVEAKRGELVTVPTNLQSLSQPHFSPARILPKLSRRFMPLGGGFVKGIFLFTEA